MDYKVQLDSYSGPLDLLLYLIKKEEVDIYDIPIAKITSQYLEYVELLQQLDPDNTAEFLVMSATLMEIKSRTLLPTPPPEEEQEEFLDPLELVRQLLEYKHFKDAARELESAAGERATRFERAPVPPEQQEQSQVDLENVQIWDLLRAFGKLLHDVGLSELKHEVIYDDTPIALHASDIIDLLERENGSLAFQSIFEGHSKSEIIGLFLAVLELIRARRVRAEQQLISDAIILHLLDGTPLMQEEIEIDRSRPSADSAAQDTDTVSDEPKNIALETGHDDQAAPSGDGHPPA